MSSDALADALANALENKVGDASGPEQITDMWQLHFLEMLNSVYNTDSKCFACDHIDFVFPKSQIEVIDKRCDKYFG